ncbi:MAG: hypothetical protein ACRCT2_09765 [Plesiomonas shigelloides]
MEILIIPFWAIGSVLVSALADNRGQSGIMAFLVAIVCSPLLMWLIVLCRPNLKREELEERRHREVVEALNRAVSQQ